MVRPGYNSIFARDNGAMCNQPSPPARTLQSHYWRLYDFAFSTEFENAITNLIAVQCGTQHLENTRLGGVQLAWSPPGSRRGPHVDPPKMAHLLITFTLEGSATIELIEVSRPSGRETFEQSRGDAYILYDTATDQIKHGVTTGGEGRWAVTARMVHDVHRPGAALLEA